MVVGTDTVQEGMVVVEIEEDWLAGAVDVELQPREAVGNADNESWGLLEH